MHRKRIISITLAGLTFVPLLVALGGGPVGAPAGPTPVKPGDPGTGPAIRVDFASLPSDESGARAIAQEFLKPGADHKKLTEALRPERAYFHEYFSVRIAERMYWMYAVDWRNGRYLIKPRRGQSNVLVRSATVEELRKQQGLGMFPPGYTHVLSDLRDGHRIYVFTFTKPGESVGRSFDGLVFVRDRWVFFPKPWSALQRSTRQKLDPSLRDSRNWRREQKQL